MEEEHLQTTSPGEEALYSILERGNHRRSEAAQPFSGELTPHEAYTILTNLPNAYLVDVRTHAEREFVGYPTLGTHIEWQSYPGMVPNPNFFRELRRRLPLQSQPVLIFMCRSGKRSAEAAAATARQGYRECYNLLEGFEGERDASGHRGNLEGWKVAGLPWEQK